MDDQVKICPQCGAEYYAHITTCKSCDVELIFPHEREEYERKLPNPEGELVCVEEGNYQRIMELATALTNAGIEPSVFKFSAEKGCASKGDFGLFVHQNIAEETAKIIDEFWHKLYPELKEIEDRLSKGLCPACGAALMGSTNVCPECGLNFEGMLDECDDDGCGSCGH